MKPEYIIGTPFHEAYVRSAPDPDHWPVLVAKINEQSRAERVFSPTRSRYLDAAARFAASACRALANAARRFSRMTGSVIFRRVDLAFAGPAAGAALRGRPRRRAGAADFAAVALRGRPRRR